MEEKSAKLFKNGRNQAVRLPKDFEFEGVDEVRIQRIDNKLIITPIRPDWVSFADLPDVAGDLLEKRTPVFDPERVIF